MITHHVTSLSKSWPPSSTSSAHWASCSLPRRHTPATSTTASSTGGHSSSSDQPVSRQANLIRPRRADPRTSHSLQEGSLGDPRNSYIRPRLVHWKVDQCKDRQQLVRFSFQFTLRHTVSLDHSKVRCARRHPGRPVLKTDKRRSYPRRLQRPFQLLHRSTRRSVLAHSIRSATTSRPVPGHLPVPFRTL